MNVACMAKRVNKRVVLGVSGGIAAYKSAELVRRLLEMGAEVRVVMTKAATHFITPLTLQALSGHAVHTDLMDPAQEKAMGHIDLARWADLVVIAPASANMMARLAHGLADDLLSTLCLATTAPLLLAPAMNRAMWVHPATQANVHLLRERGVRLIGPATGEQACGEVGPGRMSETPDIVAAVASLPGPPDLPSMGLLAGVSVLVTAGPTREAIDPVRYLSNRSSGKMGYALAAAAAHAGARVTLVSGPTALTAPPGVELVQVESAAQMRDAVLSHPCDIFIAAAAVADYAPTAAVPHKLKKHAAELSLVLHRTPDILSEVTRLARRPYTIGFAAETESLENNARAKLEAKNLDIIAANLVGPGVGFDSDDNALTVLWRDGQAALPRMPKTALAQELIQLIVARYHETYTTKDS